jgi:two-component system, sensor histidine kinase and response regulator
VAFADAPTRAHEPSVASSRLEVVVADDSPALRFLVRSALSPRRGFAVVAEATDGLEALILAESHRPDCVVLDVDMPGMGGFEALVELQRRCPGVPVVMLSGFADETERDRAIAGGAAAFLHKDLLKLLPETLREVTAGSRRRPAPDRLVDVATAPATAGASTDRADRAMDATADDLRRFEYVVSHDLAEPLRALTGFASLLQGSYSDVLDSSGTLFVEHISAAAGRMQAMVDDLLTYSRAGRQQPAEDRVDLTEIAATVLKGLPGDMDGRLVRVEVGDLPDVIGDRTMCAAVLRHLVLNGLTFNRADEPTVGIAGHRAGGAAVITVSDNGIGVAEAMHEHVFELFRRLNTREEYPGTGTGLALCRRFVAVQGGVLRLESSTADGSVFELTLPLSDDDQGV